VNITSKQRRVICGIYALLILGLSVMPESALEITPQFFPHQDKVMHALMYGGWAALLGWALQERVRRYPWAWMLGIVAVATAYGVLMEIVQGAWAWIQRTCSWGDMLANLAGAIMGAVLMVTFRSR